MKAASARLAPYLVVVHSRQGTPRPCLRFSGRAVEAGVRTRKPSGLVTPSGLLRLVSHAAMGVAMGLGFALLLMLIDLSGNTLLVQHGGSQGIAMSVGMLVLSF